MGLDCFKRKWFLSSMVTYPGGGIYWTVNSRSMVSGLFMHKSRVIEIIFEIDVPF